MPVPLEYAHTGPVAPAAPGPEGLVTLIRDRAEFFARVEAYGTQFGEEQRADAPDDGSGAGGGTLTLRGRSVASVPAGMVRARFGPSRDSAKGIG
jgi:hypothetical protein